MRSRLDELREKNIFIDLDFLSSNLRKINKQLEEKNKEYQKTNDEILKDNILELQKEKKELQKKMEDAILEHINELNFIKNNYKDVFDALIEDSYLKKIFQDKKETLKLDVYEYSAYEIEKLYYEIKENIKEAEEILLDLKESSLDVLNKEELNEISKFTNKEINNKQELYSHLQKILNNLIEYKKIVETTPYKIHEKLIKMAKEILYFENKIKKLTPEKKENTTVLLFSEKKEEIDMLINEKEKKIEELKEFILKNLQSIIKIMKNKMIKKYFYMQIEKEKETAEILKKYILDEEAAKDILKYDIEEEYSKEKFFSQLDEYEKICDENEKF